MTMSAGMLDSDTRNKLDELIDQGVIVKQRIKDEQGSFNDLIKYFSEESMLEANIIKRAINLKYKLVSNPDALQEAEDALNEAMEMLHVTGTKTPE